jgi:hypothetical protein
MPTSMCLFRTSLSCILAIAGLFQAGPLSAQPYERQHHIGRYHLGSYSPWSYWTPRVYPVVAHCRGVTAFEEPPGARYRIHLKKFHNPDFVGYHGAYSGYGPLPGPVTIPPPPAD